jgi:hypothetical protein
MIAGAAGIAAAGVGLALAAPSLLVVQLQTWRALWLVSMLAALVTPYVALRLWSLGARGRVALAMLASAWLLRDAPLGVAATLAAAFVARYAPREPPRMLLLIAWAAAGGLALGTTAIRFEVAVGLENAVGFDPLAATLKAGALGAPLVALAVALALWTPSLGRRGGWAALAVALAALIATGFVWDDRPQIVRSVEAGGARIAAPRGALMWVDGFGTGWLVSGDPEWWSSLQGAGVVFDRPLAIEWARRRDLARAAGMTGANARVTGWGLAAICHAPDGPAAVLAPTWRVALDARPLATSTWPAPTTEPPHPDTAGRLVSARDYALFPCAPAPRR